MSIWGVKWTMTEEQQAVIIKGFEVAAKDLASHKAAIDRLSENMAAEHAKLVEIAEIVNRHTEILESLRLAVEAKMLGQTEPGPIH